MHTKDHTASQTFPSQTVRRPPSQNKSTPRSSIENAEIPRPIKIVEVDFCELTDGTVLEMIEDPDDATKSHLAVSKNGQVRCVERLKVGNRVFVPLPRNTAILRNLRLPNGVESLESALDLFFRIMYFLYRTVELSPSQQILLSCFILSTWFVEKLPFAPYAAFVGPPGSGKTTALRVLNLLCRRSLLTSDIALHSV
jgi:hypothetical protein